jgi:hypothetical protein
MPTTLDFLRAKVLAYKNTLDSRSGKDKEQRVGIQIAEEFNAVLEEIRKESPDAAAHLPKPIACKGVFARDLRLSDIKFLELEMILNQVLAILDLLREATNGEHDGSGRDPRKRNAEARRIE